MNIPGKVLENSRSILDVGGWFIPEPRATHVVDLLPWETRGTKLNTSPLPGECFSKETWFQADFLDEQFKLPFPDKYFDLVICGQTIEDLCNPERLLEEMQRVGRAGIIECPSRFSEQTVGVRDRESRKAGHPHHFWIADREGEDFVLYSKKDSRLNHAATVLPLAFLEGSGLPRVLNYAWEDHFAFRTVRGQQCFQKARRTVVDLKVALAIRVKDALLRFARRSRSRLQGRGKEDFSLWREIVEQSRRYSSIELPRFSSTKEKSR